MALNDVIAHFIRDYRDSTKNNNINFTLNFYDYSRYTGFKKLSRNAFKESFRFLLGLSKNDEIGYETIYEEDHDCIVWYLKKENLERNSNGESPNYYNQFFFRAKEVAEYLKFKNISIPEYINSKLSNFDLDKDMDSKIDIPKIKNIDSIETLTIEELKQEIAVVGQKYIELTRLLINKLNLKEEQDLLKITIEYRNTFWSKPFDRSSRIKKEAHIEEIKLLTSLSHKKAEAIELVSIPINRNPDKSKH